MIGGESAVQIFYLISGFLISYILTEARSYPKLSHFYLNRVLRLYPIYYAVALVTLIASIAIRAPAFFSVYHEAPPAADAMLVLTNLTLVGQDWVYFTGVHDGHLVFMENFRDSETPLWLGLLAPQAWTLGVEISFYLIAPFVLRDRRWLFGLLCLSIGIRAYLFAAGLGGQDPWSYRFFPAELGLFLVGALSHQVLLPLYRRYAGDRLARASTIGVGALIGVTLLFPFLPGEGALKSYALYALAAALLPAAFLFQRRHRFDRLIGDLSYPIYICHILVIYSASRPLSVVGMNTPIPVTLYGIVGSIVFAIALNKLIGAPVERIRASFRRMSPAVRAPATAMKA